MMTPQSFLLMTSQWRDNCDARTWKLISNSLDIVFVRGNIYGRSWKNGIFSSWNRNCVPVLLIVRLRWLLKSDGDMQQNIRWCFLVVMGLIHCYNVIRMIAILASFSAAVKIIFFKFRLSKLMNTVSIRSIAPVWTEGLWKPRRKSTQFHDVNI